MGASLSRWLDGLLVALTVAAIAASWSDAMPAWVSPVVLGGFIIAFFARWRVDPDPAGWMRRNWWDLLLVVVLASPLARVLALFRAVVPMVRVALAFRLTRGKLLRFLLWSADTWPVALAVGLAIVFVFGAAEYAIEHPHNPGFARLQDGLWWALATVTTVGYGDLAPRTGAGRLVAALAMVFGIAVYSLITANLTVWLERAIARRRARDGQ
ncbi:MAG: potassium channel protein [Zetaproteobacteria bacterium]|nr:MAG: potassium channel protein [Zetaproteobacteria bacterium]